MSKLDQIKALGAAKTASRKSSDGIAEGRKAQDERRTKGVGPDRKSLEVGAIAQMGERSPTQGLRSGVQGPLAPVGIKAVPSEAKRGRPRIGEVRAKPWLECKPPMSKSTYYRRQKEKK